MGWRPLPRPHPRGCSCAWCSEIYRRAAEHEAKNRAAKLELERRCEQQLERLARREPPERDEPVDHRNILASEWDELKKAARTVWRLMTPWHSD